MVQTHPVSGSSSNAPEAPAPSSSNPTVAGNIAAANPGYTTSTAVNSLQDLKNKAPQVYKAMMQGIAQSICSFMEDSNQRIREAMQKMRQDS